jgi:spermidine synthase
MKRLLSYIYPITKKIKSDFSGTLEITWYNGKKHLNTKNANYSYGSLQKILKTGLTQIDLTSCNDILVLGLGGGSIIETLRKDFQYEKHITALDIDPIIIKIAQEEFHLKEEENLEIICEDAAHFMEENKDKFDLIIIDLYIDIQVPSVFLELPFWKNIIKATSKNILFNAELGNAENSRITTIHSFLKEANFTVQTLEKVLDTNTLVIANSKIIA